MANPELLLGLVSAILAGVAVKALDYFNKRGDVRANQAVRLRNELRTEARRRQDDVQRLTAELNQFKEKVFSLSLLNEQLDYKNQQLALEIELLQDKLNKM